MNCEATLLAHAELYTLACDYQLHDLQALVLSRLQSALQFLDGFTAKTPVVGNLVTLVEYIYDNTSRPTTGQEPRWKLMTSFIANNFNNFDGGDGGAVQRLLDAETDFSGDVIPMVRINITALSKKLKDSENNGARLEEPLREAQETEVN